MTLRKTRVGAYAVCVQEGQLLLVHQAAPGPAQDRWTLLGGGIDFGESPAAAVVREVREETGATAVPGELLGVHDNVYDSPEGVRRHGIRLLFSTTVNGVLRAGGDGEIDAVGWHPISDLPETTTAWAQLAAQLAPENAHGRSLPRHG